MIKRPILWIAFALAACGGEHEADSLSTIHRTHNAGVCSSESTANGETYRVLCAAGACTCEHNGAIVDSCTQNPAECSISIINGAVEAACCDFGAAPGGSSMPPSPPPSPPPAPPPSNGSNVCQTQISINGDTIEVECVDGACTCSQNGVVVDECQLAGGSCDVSIENGAVTVACCAL